MADEINLQFTARGFVLAEFKDKYGEDCSIQESSIAEGEDGSCIWLGTHRDRMHLSQEHVKQLLPMLEYFAEFGGLPHPEHDELTDRDLPEEQHVQPDPKALEKSSRAVMQFIQSYTQESSIARYMPDFYDLLQKYAAKLEKVLGDDRDTTPPEGT